MKKLILAAAALTFSLSTIAGNGDNHGDKYCAKMKDGKTVVMHEGKAITSEAKLSDGSVVKTDGTVIMKDGSKMMLSENECINADGTTVIKGKDVK